jgi:hypothetical protein
MTKKTTTVLGAVAAAVMAASAGLGIAAAAAAPNNHDDLPAYGPGDKYKPVIEREDFSPDVTNRWLPLIPGTTLTYEGTKDGKHARNLFTVTRDTKVIDGVRCRVVFDRLWLDGKLSERTFDYYAQDDDGNVWYFGEDTVSLDDQGHLTDTSGSFRSGVDGAQPGVFMQAHPQIGRRFRQEWLKGEAEDQFKVLSRNARVTVPYGTFHPALRTEERTALEPDVIDNKYYARGIGEVVETSVRGQLEKLELVSVTHS